MAASSPSSPSPPSCAGSSPARASTSGTFRSTSCPCGASPSQGLAAGEVRLWNPFVHEGVPLSLPALGYPIDLLQLLRPDEAGLSAHPRPPRAPGRPRLLRARAGALARARRRRRRRRVVYALGGFLLSCLNLYVHLQAAAWAPLLVLGLVRVLGGGSRRAAGATALVLAVALSTTGVEIVAQALVCGIVLGARGRGAREARRWGRLALGVGLGVAIAAPVLLLVSSQVAGSARGQGFPTDVVLAHSVHPFTLVQTLVGGLYGNLSNLAGEWWGQNFFPRGFPYVLSLYLGAAALAVAAVGARSGHPLARRLAVLVALGLVVSVGRWAGLTPVVDALPALRLVRFPVKAFYTAHFAVALLAALGLSSLARRRRPASLAAARRARGRRRRVARAGAARAPARAGRERRLRRGLLPPRLRRRRPGRAPRAGPGRRGPRGRRRAGRGRSRRPGLAAGPRRPPGRGDGGRPHRRRPAPDRGRSQPDGDSGVLPALARARGAPRVLPRAAASSAAVSRRARGTSRARVARRTEHEAWSFALLLETLTPAFNVPLGVPTALSPDLTMLVPADRVFSPAEASCRDLDAILPRLREAAVRFVLSVDPLAHPDLEPDGAARARAHRPARRAGLPAEGPPPPSRGPRPRARRRDRLRREPRRRGRRVGRTGGGACCATAGPRAGRRASTDVPPRFACTEGTASCRSPRAAAGWRWPTGPRVSRLPSPRAGSASWWRPSWPDRGGDGTTAPRGKGRAFDCSAAPQTTISRARRRQAESGHRRDHSRPLRLDPPPRQGPRRHPRQDPRRAGLRARAGGHHGRPGGRRHRRRADRRRSCGASAARW